MPVTTFYYDRARTLGLDPNALSGFPADCYIKTYEGCVLDTYENNGSDDSDFYAIVWDEASQSVKNVMYATTRGGSYHNGARVDATDDAKSKAAAYWTALHRKNIEARIRREMDGPYVGATATIVRGRKAPKGFKGVIRLLEKRHNPHMPQPRFSGNAWSTNELWALVEADKGAWTVRADYLEIEPNPAAIDEAIAKALAEYDVNRARVGTDISWRSQPYQSMHLAGVNLDGVR